nr:flagellar biosynthetic protein FliQ [uncultured Anaerotignum sp.]
MDNAQALDILRVGVMIAVKLSAPILLLSMGIGILISIVQAATQIHEQTLTFVPKLLVIVVVLLASGSWMLQVMQQYVVELFGKM